MNEVREMDGFSARITGAGYGRLVIVPELELFVPRGQVLVILGANGAGKSTSLKAIAGMVKTSQRKIALDGRDLSLLPTWRLVQEGIAFGPDGAKCFANQTVEENLLGAFQAVHPVRDAKLYRERRDRVHELFPILGQKASHLAGSMSGGQRQMLVIGRALMIDPKVIVLDEPSAGLAPKLVEEVFADLGRIKRKGGTTMIMAEQNVACAHAIADQCVVLESGRVALSGPAQELFRDDRLRTAYLSL
jgi:branched-chain amino acid transport system ATP-binding protein